jgi:hypothetical protein
LSRAGDGALPSFLRVPTGWQVQKPQPFGEMVSRVWGGTGSPRRCALRGALEGERDEIVLDVVEVRVIPEHFEHGCLLPAHGTMTVDVRSDDARLALQDLARSREAVVLERPDGGALEMRLGVLFTTRTAHRRGGVPAGSTLTCSWHSP